MVSIFAVDGSVAVTHGGVETGQGIHTKVSNYMIRYILTVEMQNNRGKK